MQGHFVLHVLVFVQGKRARRLKTIFVVITPYYSEPSVRSSKR